MFISPGLVALFLLWWLGRYGIPQFQADLDKSKAEKEARRQAGEKTFGEWFASLEGRWMTDADKARHAKREISPWAIF